jgi:excisionase family DNA binding protein
VSLLTASGAESTAGLTGFSTTSESMNAPSPDRRLLTPEEVGAELRVTRKTVYNWIKSRALPAVKVGPRSWRIRREALDQFLKVE